MKTRHILIWVTLFSNPLFSQEAVQDDFEYFEIYMAQMIDSDEVVVKFLCRVEEFSGVRRDQMKRLAAEVPKLAKPSNIYFDVYCNEYIYNKQATSGTFGYFKVNRTPAILVFLPESGFHVVQYEPFYKFLKGTHEISLEKIKELITNF